MQNKQKKEPYTKPVLKIINLAAEEVLAIGCKTADGGFSALHAICLVVPPCATEGS